MSVFVFYAVRFSPAPELGEWLNVAVVGEGITERRAGLIVTQSLDRVASAFGEEAVERVNAICRDLEDRVVAITLAHKRGEEAPTIPSSVKDMALSVVFSEQIVVFEGAFEEALRNIAKKYLPPQQEPLTEANRIQQAAGNRPVSVGDADNDFFRIAGSLQEKLTNLSRITVPPVVAKSIEQGKKALEGIVQPPTTPTVLVVGRIGHLTSALIPELLDGGHHVRHFDPYTERVMPGEDISGTRSTRTSIAEVAAQAGVTALTASKVLLGELGGSRVSDSTIERIKDAARRLGYSTGLKDADHDVASMLNGVDVVVCVADSAPDIADAQGHPARLKRFAEEAKSHGVRRFVIASSCHVYGKGSDTFHEESPLNPATSTGKRSAEIEHHLNSLSDDSFAVTVLRFGDLYGYRNESTWFGDLEQMSTTNPHDMSVNVLAAKAALEGKLSVVDSQRRPFVHVDDAVGSILAVLSRSADETNGQIYNVGSDDQIRTIGEVAQLIRQFMPEAGIHVVEGDIEDAPCEVSFEKVSVQLGYVPQKSLEDGIAQVLAVLEATGLAERLRAELQVSPGTRIGIDFQTLESVTVESEPPTSKVRRDVKQED